MKRPFLGEDDCVCVCVCDRGLVCVSCVFARDNISGRSGLNKVLFHI